MRINVLGPVELLDGSCVLATPRGSRRRAVLAALLLHPDRPVSRGRLAEAVWDDRPPPSAAANIRTYAADLRRALGPTADGRARVVGDRSGYTLAVCPGELDLLDFRRLAEAGRGALAAGDREAAAENLDRAVRLWRGPAFDGIELSSWAEARVSAVEEQRWGVLSAWVDVQTALGRYGDLDVRLREMLAEQPLAEGAWARLMLVLERTGRVSEAVAAFAEARAVLRDRLGTEPGTELRAAYARVRAGAGEPPTRGRERPVAPPRTAIVCSLPRPPALVGRAEAVAAVRAALCTPGGPVGVAVDGVAGAGKTALALHVAAGSRDRFPDGRLYLSLGGSHPESTTAALGTLLRGLGVPGGDVPEGQCARAHLFRLLLACRSALVVLDDVTDSDHVRPLLPGEGASRVLIIGRRRLTALVGVESCRVGPLPLDAAVRMLESLLGEQRVRPERVAAERLARACGGMPGALQVVAARLLVRPEQPLAALAARLADPAARLDELVAGDCSVRAGLAATFDALSPGERHAALLIAAAGPRPLTTESIARILGQPPARADLLVEGLICANVLVAVPASGYRLDGLFALHVREVAAAARAAPPRVRHGMVSAALRPAPVVRAIPRPAP